MHSISSPGRIERIFSFYVDGFRSMRLGRFLWKIVLIKLFILFAILKLFFFPNFLSVHFSSDADRAAYVLGNLTTPASDHNRPAVRNETSRLPRR